jgi:hypothetical protein
MKRMRSFPQEMVPIHWTIPDLIAYFQKITVLIGIRPCNLAGFFWQGFWGRANGHMSMRSAVRWLLWAVFRIYVGESLLEDALLGLRHASAPARLRHPPLSDDAVLPVSGAVLNVSNTALSFAPPPPWGRDGARGAAVFLKYPIALANVSGKFPGALTNSFLQIQSRQKIFPEKSGNLT